METNRMKRTDPANSPIQAGSLTTDERGNTSYRSVVTKSREGKGQTGRTRNQSEGQGKTAGCRPTNACKHRNGKPSDITDRDGKFGSRASVLWVKAAVMGEETGGKRPMSRRCKRRLHAGRVFISNWGDPVAFREREGVETIKRAHTTKRSQGSHGNCSPRLSGKREQLRISCGIRRKAESQGDVLQGVGVGYRSDDGQDPIIFPELRATSVCNVFKAEWSQ